MSGKSLFTSFRFSETWVQDALLFLSQTAFGPPGLVGIKAFAVGAAAAALVWWYGKGLPGWVPALGFGLAWLALSPYLPLTPLTTSLVFSVGILLATDALSKGFAKGFSPLFCSLLWLFLCNQTGPHGLVGWLLGFLVLLGANFDRAPEAGGKLRLGLCLWIFPGALLVAFNPGIGFGLNLSPEFQLPVLTGPGQPRSPFTPASWESVKTVPGLLAYFPLVSLALIFALAPGKGPGLSLRLPTFIFALLSLASERWVPWLALVAGPCITCRLGGWFSEEGESPNSLRTPLWLSVLTGILATSFLALAWPGWLQGTPYERRSLALHLPPAGCRVAAVESQWREKGLLTDQSRSLHLRNSSIAAFIWNQPSLKPFTDLLQDDLPSLLSERRGVEGVAKFCRDKDCHLVITEPDPNRMQFILQALVEHSDLFSIWHLDGPIVVAGCTHQPGQPKKPTQVDWQALAFGEKATRLEDAPLPPWPGPFPLGNAFTKPRPGSESAGLAAEARELIFIADGLRKKSAGLNSPLQWSSFSAQYLGLLEFASPPQAALHLGLTFSMPPGPLLTSPKNPQDPPLNPSPGALALGAWKNSLLPAPGEGEQRALLTLAIRKARESVSLDPSEARGWLAAGESSIRLLRSSAEKIGANSFAEWRQLREAQAAFSLKRALIADPSLEMAHLQLAFLFTEMGLRDQEAYHLRQAWLLAQKRGVPKGIPPGDWRDRQTAQDNEIKRLESEITANLARFSREGAGKSALERSRLALDLGLGLLALDELLASDISAFGVQGMILEVDLLLRMGRADEVHGWVNSGEHEGFLPPDLYHWIRAKSAAALGYYDEACQEAVSLTHGQSRLVLPFAPSAALAISRDALDRVAAPANGIGSIWNQVPPNDLDSQLSTMLQRWRLEMNGFAVLGLLSLEKGECLEGFRALREALSLSNTKLPPDAGPSLDFPARRLARSVLEMLEPQSSHSGR